MKVLLTRRAAKALDNIPDLLAHQIVQKLKILAKNPTPKGSLKLTRQNNYRLRIGVYRAIYTINRRGKTVTILRIAHRKQIYR
jgi:mRNA interferase RelE/StbE